ncbi:hypothetical protein Ccrd_011001 [Cynara cardunculus var. scolymus]|uniref:Leucine-rich repeat-containing protein n=1 Tax=Cynara cardunculus var. scolymus TaxID=59895 RepID=A0A118K6G0_CYNCS|nr:hypothetical protein Ccrd_011001 [Cynara cardunculus var. scolymus]
MGKLSGQIPREISQLIQLSLLDLSRNKLELQSPSLGNLMQNLTPLEELDLSGVDISSSNEFPTTILQLPKLKVLDLGKNMDLTGRVPSEVANMTQLVRLTIGFNELTGTIPSLVSLSKLALLEFSNNKFENWSLPNWIGKLTELQELYGSRGNIFGEIPSFLSNLTKLRIFDMSHNSLSGHIPSSSFSSCTNHDLQVLEKWGKSNDQEAVFEKTLWFSFRYIFSPILVFVVYLEDHLPKHLRIEEVRAEVKNFTPADPPGK